MGSTDSQYDLTDHRLPDFRIQGCLQFMTKHMQLMKPDGIVDAEVQVSAPEVLHVCPLLDATGYHPIPGVKERQVTGDSIKAQSLQAALNDIRAFGWGRLLSPLHRSIDFHSVHSTAGDGLADWVARRALAVSGVTVNVADSPDEGEKTRDCLFTSALHPEG